MSSYLQTLEDLAATCRECVRMHLVAASGDSKWAQILENIRQETALPGAAFKSLLEHFAAGINAGRAPMEAWRQACWKHQRKGATMSGDARPGLLGRAMPVKQYAAMLLDAAGIHTEEISQEALENELATYRKAPIPARFQRLCRSAKIGRNLIWATFNETELIAESDPFHPLSKTFNDIISGLGLGHFMETPVPLVLLSYKSDEPDATPSLHRPTVADAADGSYYRPFDIPSHPYGYTKPLSAGLARKPEVVHEPINGTGLVFPYTIVFPATS